MICGRIDLIQMVLNEGVALLIGAQFFLKTKDGVKKLSYGDKWGQEKDNVLSINPLLSSGLLLVIESPTEARPAVVVVVVVWIPFGTSGACTVVVLVDVIDIMFLTFVLKNANRI